ncbi:hypothetical protein ABPG74_013337 [Tetrahymena malaccensis]
MQDQIFIKIEEILHEIDRISNEQSITNDQFKIFQRSLEDQMIELENQDFEAYAYYKYLIAEKYLLKIELSEQQKKSYHRQLDCYKEQYLNFLKNVAKDTQNNKNEEEKDNISNNKNEEVKDNISVMNELEKINKLIESLVLIDEKVIEDLKQKFGLITQIDITIELIQFNNNNKIFDEIYSHARMIEDNFNDSNIILSEQEKYQNFQIFRQIFRQFCNLTSFLNLEFFQKMYHDKNFKEKYYGEDTIDLEAFQNKRRILLKIIHPDKIKRYFRSEINQYQEKGKEIMRILIQRNQDWETEIKQNIQNLEQQQQGKDLIQVYLTKAQIYFQDSNKKYKMLQNNQQNTLQFKELEKKKNQDAQKSYQFYLQAMKCAQKHRLIEQAIIIRNNISLCFYLMKNYILAHLYAIGSLYIIEKNKNIQNRLQLYDDTIKVLNKIRGQLNKKTNQQQGDSQLQLMPLNSENTYQNITDLVIQQVNQLKLEPYNQILILRYEKSEECDIQNQLNLESVEVTNIKRLQVKTVKTVAFASGAVSVILDIGFIYCAGLGVFSVFAFPFIYCQAKKYINQYQEASEKQNQNIYLREKLNSIIKEAIEYHKKREYYQFLKKMQTQFNSQNEKLINIIEVSYLFVTYDKFIDILLENGFRPDSVAYLLVLIGEAILFCNEFNSKYFTSQKQIAMGIYQNVQTNEKLMQQAQDIDLLILKLIAQNGQQQKYKNYCKNNLEKFMDCLDQDLKVDSKYSIANFDIKMQKYQSYENNLKEIQDIAHINICLIYILDIHIQEAKEILKYIIHKTRTCESLDIDREYKIQTICEFIKIFDTEFNSDSQQYLSSDNQQLGHQECEQIKSLREKIEQEKFDQAIDQIYQLILQKQNLKDNFDQKLFYYWCIICLDKLNKKNEIKFFIQKYCCLPTKDQNYDQRIQQIKLKYF